MDPKGKVALVTGGGTGLGRVISEFLAARGCAVAVNYSRSVDDANATVAALRAAGVDAEAVQGDVSRSADVTAMVDRVVERFGGLDIVVNNAGTTRFVAMKDLDGMPEEDWDRIQAVNTKGPWLVARAGAPHMRARGGGVIVNVASIAGLAPVGSSMAYGVSKAGMIHLTKSLALALAPDIRVNAIAPGLLLTRWWEGQQERLGREPGANSLLKRAVPLEDCARQIMTFVENESMTGQIVVLDSGVVMR